jgi:hypothetical protein
MSAVVTLNTKQKYGLTKLIRGEVKVEDLNNSMKESLNRVIEQIESNYNK